MPGIPIRTAACRPCTSLSTRIYTNGAKSVDYEENPRPGRFVVQGVPYILAGMSTGNLLWLQKFIEDGGKDGLMPLGTLFYSVPEERLVVVLFNSVNKEDFNALLHKAGISANFGEK
jgi:hypothetical protein